MSAQQEPIKEDIMAKINRTARLVRGQAGLGPKQDPKTAPAGAEVYVTSVTADGRLAHIIWARFSGYTPVSNLVFV
jgi:hypothetical protein